MSVPNRCYEALANRTHQRITMNPSKSPSLLNQLETGIDAVRSKDNCLTEEQLEREYKDLSTHELAKKISQKKGSYEQVRDTTADKGARIAKVLAQMEAEMDRRNKSKSPWLKTVCSISDMCDH